MISTSRQRKRFVPALPDAAEPRISPSLLVPAPVAMPAPACDSGDDPPITQPDLPGTGPGGPGSSS